MMTVAPATTKLRRRILIVDDNRDIHSDFKKILRSRTAEEIELEKAEASLFGQEVSSAPTVEFEIDSAYQGQEAHAMMQQAMMDCDPYSVAFVDVQMPPGWDGIHTAERLWELNPELQIVICTAYSNYSWGEIAARLGTSAQLLILKKPFDNIEVLQLALALTQKWHLTRESLFHRTMLEQTVLERTRQLSAAKEAAEIASNAKNEFLSTISHEIRTPMNGLLGLSEILVNECRDDSARDVARALQQSSQALMKILGEILDFTQIRTEGLELKEEDFAVEKLVKASIDSIAVQATHNGLALCSNIDDDVPRVVFADMSRFRQVLGNLLNNAVKFTADGSVSVTVRIQSGPTGRLLKFEVTDTGCGVHEGVKARIFQTFSQGDSSLTRRHGGVGLGLAISKRIVELLGGAIGFTSIAGQGSTFWFTAPIKPAQG